MEPVVIVKVFYFDMLMFKFRPVTSLTKLAQTSNQLVFITYFILTPPPAMMLILSKRESCNYKYVSVIFGIHYFYITEQYQKCCRCWRIFKYSQNETGSFTISWILLTVSKHRTACFKCLLFLLLHPICSFLVVCHKLQGDCVFHWDKMTVFLPSWFHCAHKTTLR